MTISIPQIPMDDELIDQLMGFLEDSTDQMRTLRKTLARLEDVTNSVCVCDAQVSPYQKIEVHLIWSQWLQLANVWPQDLTIRSQYSAGSETHKPWAEYLFHLTMKHGGVTYFTLMTGAQIDQAGIEIINKEALMRGDG